MDGKVRVKSHGMGNSNNTAKSKNKQKESGSIGGKVTQFKSIDDIPNINEDDIQWSEQQQPSNAQYMQQQFQDGQYYPSSGYNSKPSYDMLKSNEEVSSKQQNIYNSSSYSNHYQEQPNNYSAPQQANDHYYRNGFRSNMWPENHRDDFRNHQIQEEIEEAEVEEDQQDDDSSDGDNPLPVPPYKGGNKLTTDEDDGYRGNNHGVRKVGAKQSNSKHNNNMNMAAPPLPCDLKKNVEKKLTGKEKLFFSKEPRAVEFKPYTLGQYNLIKPKEYMEISNIKPDLNTEELIAKRANLDRVKEFAKNLHNFNHEHLRTQKKLPPSNEKNEMEIAHKKLESKRQKAIEFAKNIPKPKIPAAKDFNSKQAGDEEGVGNSGFDMGEGYEEELKLQELEAKHVNSKKQIEAIRKAMGMN